MCTTKYARVTLPSLSVSVVHAVAHHQLLPQTRPKLLGHAQQETWLLVLPQVQDSKKPQSLTLLAL